MTDDPPSSPSLQATKEQAARTVEEFRSAAAAKARRLRDAAEDQAGAFRDSAGAIRDHAESQAGQLRDSAGEQWSATQARMQELQTELEHYVRGNPTKAVIVAFGLGLVMGAILRR